MPVTVEDVVLDVLAAASAGAGEAHVHPKDPEGHDSLRPEHVDPVIDALRTALPGLPISVTTGAWATEDPDERLFLVRGWHTLPDYVSINWHEEGASELADLVASRGIAIEAGLWYHEAAERFASHATLESCRRILIEATEIEVADALLAAQEILRIVDSLRVPILMHGEGSNTWPIFDLAVASGLDTRIGLEDTTLLPDGGMASGNRELVEAAVRRARSARRT